MRIPINTHGRICGKSRRVSGIGESDLASNFAEGKHIVSVTAGGCRRGTSTTIVSPIPEHVSGSASARKLRNITYDETGNRFAVIGIPLINHRPTRDSIDKTSLATRLEQTHHRRVFLANYATLAETRDLLHRQIDASAERAIVQECITIVRRSV